MTHQMKTADLEAIGLQHLYGRVYAYRGISLPGSSGSPTYLHWGPSFALSADDAIAIFALTCEPDDDLTCAVYEQIK